MKRKFELIDEMLDRVIGGKGASGLYALEEMKTEDQDVEKCTELCSYECMDVVYGSKKGNITGFKFPD